MKKSFTFFAAALAFFATVQAQTVVEFDILNPTGFETGVYIRRRGNTVDKIVIK